MQYAEDFKKMLQELDARNYVGGFELEHSQTLHTILDTPELLYILEEHFKNACQAKDFNKFRFLTVLMATDGSNLPQYDTIYLLMMDTVLSNEPITDNRDEIELLLESILDLFWHRRDGLESLDKNGQTKLNRFLNFVATFKYNVDTADEIFVAIDQSMDLIRYQKTFGNSPALIDLYLDHFDKLVAQRAKEYQSYGWL